jgi:hypothetical protein
VKEEVIPKQLLAFQKLWNMNAYHLTETLLEETGQWSQYDATHAAMLRAPASGFPVFYDETCARRTGDIFDNIKLELDGDSRRGMCTNYVGQCSTAAECAEHSETHRAVPGQGECETLAEHRGISAADLVCCAPRLLKSDVPFEVSRSSDATSAFSRNAYRSFGRGLAALESEELRGPACSVRNVAPDVSNGGEVDAQGECIAESPCLSSGGIPITDASSGCAGGTVCCIDPTPCELTPAMNGNGRVGLCTPTTRCEEKGGIVETSRPGCLQYSDDIACCAMRLSFRVASRDRRVSYRDVATDEGSDTLSTTAIALIVAGSLCCVCTVCVVLVAGAVIVVRRRRNAKAGRPLPSPRGGKSLSRQRSRRTSRRPSAARLHPVLSSGAH